MWGRMGKGGGAVRFHCLRRRRKIKDLCRLCKRIVQGKGAGGASPRRATPPPCHKCIVVRRVACR